MIVNKRARTSYAGIPQDTKNKRNQRHRELDDNLPEAARIRRNERRRLLYADHPKTYADLPQSTKDRRNECRKQLRLDKKQKNEESTRAVCSRNMYGNPHPNIHTMVLIQTSHPTNSKVMTNPFPDEIMSTDQDATQPFVAGVITKVSRSSNRTNATSIHEIGRILIATENPNKIEGEVQLVVNGRNYIVRVEEEDTFRTVSSTNLVSNFEVNLENEEGDVEVVRIDDEVDDIKNKKQNSVGDMEIQGNEILDDRAKINEEEAKKVEKNCINGSHQAGLEKEPVHEELLAQRKSVRGKHIENLDSCENNKEESFNSDHGLDSIVQDSQSPLIEDCFESIRKNIPVQNAESNLEVSQDQENELGTCIQRNMVFAGHAEAAGVHARFASNRVEY
ncbi:hypothetical protein RHGRI_010049 [Rhododendron griersonianum]|uniref:Uncharacterized protein n=1 Tax=Rhododendron griersonianum TaxID=479676 RepID=A0AAV6KH40_9ERIC|nr:hypothetical protein RHGRI_010049 [Rhododendron griersonianum]